MSKNLVQPKSLPGVMELLPKQQVLFDEIKNKIENVYKSFGFLPLDTPVIERADVLLAKAGGETEKQIYRFAKGDNDICLRFDLTVPLAKYVSANINNLEFPFRRYQIGKVYRGEKAQRGRYREFYQCDIDIIGKENLSLKNDAECPAIIYSIFKSLDFGDFEIQINNRKVIIGLLESLNLLQIKDEVMRLLDKKEKIGMEKLALSLQDLNIDSSKIETIKKFLSIDGTNDERLEKLKGLAIENETFSQGVFELSEVVRYIKLQNVPEKYYSVKPSIIRGLDYYTGTIFETILKDYPQLGSVCGGGRYDNLAGYYTETKLPGVGISIGITRLFFQLYESNLIKANQTNTVDVLVLPMDESCFEKAYEYGCKLRENNISCQVYLEDKKFKNKLTYASNLSIPYVLILGEDEIANSYVSFKDMNNHSQENLTIEEVCERLKK